MADRVRKIAHFNASIPNEPGEGARLLGNLRDAGVNLLAFWGYPTGHDAQIEMVPENPAKFVRVMTKAGVPIGPRQEGLYVTGPDRPGAMGDVLRKLAAAGINAGAVQGVASEKRHWGAVVYLAPKQIATAMKALRSKK